MYFRTVLFSIYLLELFYKETAAYLSPHPLKEKVDKPIVMLPLILFTDDTSGNKSKKWHKFDSWYMSLAGLPRHLSARQEHIHFVCCSDVLSALELSEPISEELIVLEQYGITAFDAYLQQEVLVFAPFMFIVCDNPRASELVNHLGSTALKYCRFCMVRYSCRLKVRSIKMIT